MASFNKRLRVFAGPNGSGKSTVIDSIRQKKVGERTIDFGIYINADDIAAALRSDNFCFSSYQLPPFSRSDFIDMALATGLISDVTFPEVEFRKSFSLNQAGEFRLKAKLWHENLAQILAAVIRERLLVLERKISFETVFSHESKLDFMARARDQGYRIYLYFIATKSPEINIARIKEVRIKQGGHDVPEEKIRGRYQRSMDLLFDAAELAYQAYFFDNSVNGAKQGLEPFAHFKVIQEKKSWDKINAQDVPDWFYRYYLTKT
ncbi:MAG: hypothetical protein Q7V56_10230 [Gammaproteobacteria bacterium]|nr:hypothetical protein [Gammaproteobacteria bacterium]